MAPARNMLLLLHGANHSANKSCRPDPLPSCAHLVALGGPSWLRAFRIILEHVYASFELPFALRIYRIQPRELQQLRVSIALLESLSRLKLVCLSQQGVGEPLLV